MAPVLTKSDTNQARGRSGEVLIQTRVETINTMILAQN